MAQSSQRKEPPQNPGRFNHPALATVEDLVLLAQAGRPMPTGALERKAPKVREHIEHVIRTTAKRHPEG
jgi:hypothetical protein